MAEERDEQSKRARQKERRAAKREEQVRAEAAAKRRRTFATIGVVVLAVAAVGVLLQGQIRGMFERRSVVAEAQERLDDFGCTDIVEMDDLGAGHFAGQPDELSQNPPADIYEHRPTTSGRHLGQVTVTGVYDEYVDERLTTHNMEHGYVIMWWNPELPADEVAELQQWAQEMIDDGYDHLIAAPYEEALPDGGDIAFVSWGYRQLCDDFDPQIAQAFLVERHNSAEVPEPMAGPHFGGNPGELVPDEDATLFPPFDEAAPGEPAMEDGGTDDDEG